MIIIPTYNEKNNIRELTKTIRRSAGDIRIMFVDDSSPDGTAEEVRKLQEKDENIKLLVRPKKKGIGPAYRQAMKKIVEEGLADFIITMDADLSHPPQAIPKIVELLQKSSVVVGSRYVAGGRVENWNWFRRLVSRLGSAYARILTGTPVCDMTAGFVGYSVGALRHFDFSKMKSNGYNFQIEMKYLLHRAGRKIVETPITFSERGQGKSKFSFEIIVEAMLYPWKLFLKRIF